jgi:hypothetical protein
MYLIDKDVLFIHIPKTSGKLITDNMAKNSIKPAYGHLPYKIWKDLYPNIGANTKSFTYVRNPFDRMISLYFYGLSLDRYEAPQVKRIAPWFSKDDSIDFDFNKWLEWNYNTNINNLKKIKAVDLKTNEIEMISYFELYFSNQIYLLYDKDNVLNQNIHIIKYEDFCSNNNIIEEYFEKINLTNYDFRRVVNESKHNHYTSYYNQESIKLIKKYFEEDLKVFNYKFNN